MNFKARYILNLESTKFISFVVIGFLVSLLFFEIRANIYDLLYLADDYNQETILRSKIALIFQSIISLFFLIRFIFLYFTKTKYVWLSQIFWLLGWMSVVSYQQVSEQYFGPAWAGEHIGSFFEGILSVTSSWLLAYMVLSPIKQIAILIFSFFYRK